MVPSAPCGGLNPVTWKGAMSMLSQPHAFPFAPAAPSRIPVGIAKPGLAPPRRYHAEGCAVVVTDVVRSVIAASRIRFCESENVTDCRYQRFGTSDCHCGPGNSPGEATTFPAASYTINPAFHAAAVVGFTHVAS